MSLLYSAGAANYIGVVDIEAATAWYIDKLGLLKMKAELDDGEGCIALGSPKMTTRSVWLITALDSWEVLLAWRLVAPGVTLKGSG